MTVPFPFSEENSVSNDMAFASFLPLWDEDSLQITEDTVSLRMGFDSTCVSILGEDRNYSKMMHVPVGRILVEVTVPDPSEALIVHIKNKSPHIADSGLLAEYKALGKRVYDVLIRSVNKLSQYARAVKGQYWLEEYEVDSGNMMSAFNYFRAAVYFDEACYRFCPSNEFRWSGVTPSGKCLITRDDWKTVVAFITKGKPPLVGQLLAAAQYLAKKGHKRAALTEAVTALEVAVFTFGKKPNSEAFGKIMMERMGITSLKNQIEHLGFSASVKYLLPLIVTDAVLPTDVLKTCQEAIGVRQNVVHHGGNLKTDDLWRFLRHIRQMCETLSSLTSTE